MGQASDENLFQPHVDRFNTLPGENVSHGDEEVFAVNALKSAEAPGWARQVMQDLPSLNFELCGQNWNTGLDECIGPIQTDVP
jgi:hypothetical protein